MFKVDILIVDQIANKEILPRHVATIIQPLWHVEEKFSHVNFPKTALGKEVRGMKGVQLHCSICHPLPLCSQGDTQLYQASDMLSG